MTPNHSLIQNQTPLSLVLGGMLIAACIWWISTYNQSTPQANIPSLTAEFNSAYAAQIEPTGEVKEFTLTAAENQINLIGNTSTRVWSYNNQLPGPELRVQKGDTVRIKFTNQLPQPTTIHWHGIRVPNAMDGVPSVTQNPIQPGQSYTYEFTPKDAGTFWYHPHVRSSEQVERGLYGSLVVEDPNDPQYDLDQVLMIDDWRLTDDGQVSPNFNTMHDLMHDGRWGQHITVNGKSNFDINARPGQRLRLRLVNPSNGRIYKLNFNNLAANAIAVDGMKVGQTFSAEGFELAPGNRLDVDITVPLASSTSYTISDSFTRNRISLATIKVSGAPTKPKNFSAPTANYLPQWQTANSAPITAEYVLDATRGMSHSIAWTLNGEAFPNTQPVTLQANTFQKIRFTNDSARLHPMHLHGQFFKVIARNGQTVTEPYWRDTVLIHPREQVDIALVPLDQGKWVNHCHILEHAEAGMMSIVQVQ